MDQFEYVMVLVSIIVGLGIAYILLGISGIFDRLSRKKRPVRIQPGACLVARYLLCVAGHVLVVGVPICEQGL